MERLDRVLLLTLNRPDSLNALTAVAVNELGARLEEAGNDPGVGAVVVTGAGDAFSSGGDLAFLRTLHTMPPARVRETIYGGFQWPTRAMRSMGKPVVAAVNGAAVGAGCEIAVAADFRIASERARFGEVWIRLGCVPALGGMFLLPRNRSRAGGRRPGPASPIATAKAALNRGLHSDLWSELDQTVEDQIGCFATEDFVEGRPRALGPAAAALHGLLKVSGAGGTGRP